MSDTASDSSSAASEAACIAVIDDDESFVAAIAGFLRSEGHRVVPLTESGEIFDVLARERPDAVITDLVMPCMHGLDVLRELRTRGAEAPVIVLTGVPDVPSAAAAVELGAFRYLVKPIIPADLARVVADAIRVGRTRGGKDPCGRRGALERRFASALDGMWMALQPIVCTTSRELVGWETLLRTSDDSFGGPIGLIAAAEELGAVHALGRRARELVSRIIDTGPPINTYFVNVHPSDLADPDLLDPSASLSRHASRVVLELTERSTLDAVPDVGMRLNELRRLGYRLAVDDLGAGYAGLSYFATVSPELVKIDMSLVRDVDTDSVKQRVVLAIVTLARQLGMEVVGEGVETAGERDALVRLGCTYLQGYLFARPGRPYPTASWLDAGT